MKTNVRKRCGKKKRGRDHGARERVTGKCRGEDIWQCQNSTRSSRAEARVKSKLCDGRRWERLAWWVTLESWEGKWQYHKGNRGATPVCALQSACGVVLHCH